MVGDDLSGAFGLHEAGAGRDWWGEGGAWSDAGELCVINKLTGHFGSGATHIRRCMLRLYRCFIKF